MLKTVTHEAIFFVTEYKEFESAKEEPKAETSALEMVPFEVGSNIKLK